MLDSKEKISDFLKLSVLCYFQNFKNSYSMESLSEYIKSLIGTEGYVDKNTWELVLTKQPDVIEEEPADETEELVQENAEILESLYTEEVSDAQFVPETSELLTSDAAVTTEETEEVFDQTDIQVMILTENMAAFGSEENVFDNTSFAENSDVSIIDQMLVNTSAQ